MMKKYATLIGLVGVALLLAGFVVYSINSAITTIAAILFIAGVVGVIGYIILKFNEIKSGLSSRSTKFGSNAALMVIILFGIMVVINILATRFSFRADTTAAKVYSLADQTRKVLKNLDKDVTVYGFFKSNEEGLAKEFMVEYAHYTQKLKYEFIDPDKEPGLAKKYEVKSYGTLVIECEDKLEKITTVSEQEITNALIKVTREGVKKVYFTTGHGEKDYDNSEQTGMSKAKEVIQELNYEIEKIFLVQAPDSIPNDCSLLIVAGPQTELLLPEKTKMDAYLKRGGKVMLLLDPESPQSYVDYAKEWGVIVGNDLIVELSPVGQLFGAGPIMPVVTNYEKHAITEGFGGMMTIFPQVRSVRKAEEAPTGVQVTEVAKSSPNSWAETTPIGAEGKVGFDENSDIQGPVSICAVAEKSAENPVKKEDKYDLGTGDIKTRLVIFGDSDFATNAYFDFQANGNFFLNSLNWLAEEEDLISIRPRDPEDRRLNLTQKQSKMILWLGVILLPIVVFAFGIYIYRRRK